MHTFHNYFMIIEQTLGKTCLNYYFYLLFYLLIFYFILNTSEIFELFIYYYTIVLKNCTKYDSSHFFRFLFLLYNMTEQQTDIHNFDNFFLYTLYVTKFFFLSFLSQPVCLSKPSLELFK